MSDLCRTHGITEQTYYRWKAKYGGLELSEMQRLKQLEDENRRLKHIVAEQTLDIQALKAVVTHEASDQVHTDVDIEAFDNLAFGSHLMDELASCMRGSGKYVAFVGHTTARSHMRWATAAYERARQKYPKIVRISAPVETAERSSVVDVAGIGRAVREAGLQGKTCVMGTSLPSELRMALPAPAGSRSISQM